MSIFFSAVFFLVHCNSKIRSTEVNTDQEIPENCVCCGFRSHKLVGFTSSSSSYRCNSYNNLTNGGTYGSFPSSYQYHERRFLPSLWSSWPYLQSFGCIAIILLKCLSAQICLNKQFFNADKRFSLSDDFMVEHLSVSLYHQPYHTFH
jgi:hypothetical protein